MLSHFISSILYYIGHALAAVLAHILESATLLAFACPEGKLHREGYTGHTSSQAGVGVRHG